MGTRGPTEARVIYSKKIVMMAIHEESRQEKLVCLGDW
jgi:hypothetical protein